MTTEQTTQTAPYLYEILPDGRFAFYLDHHTLSGFSKCEAFFKLRNFFHASQVDLDGDQTPAKCVRPRGRAFKRDIGVWWARTMEWYYTAMAEKTLTKVVACELAAEAWKQEKMDDLKSEFPSSYEKFGGLIGATQMIAEYCDFSIPYDTRFWDITAIEAGFGRKREVKIGENDRVVVYWLGKPDLFVRDQGRYVPIDHKTKDAIASQLVHQFKPHPQTAGYIIAAQVIADSKNLGITIDRCLVNVAARSAPTDNPRNGVKKPRFLRIPVFYSQSELVEWKTQTLAKATRLRHCIENDEWNWNEDACHTFSGCDYRPIHSVPAESRLIVINSQYTITDPWIAYTPEDD